MTPEIRDMLFRLLKEAVRTRQTCEPPPEIAQFFDYYGRRILSPDGKWAIYS